MLFVLLACALMISGDVEINPGPTISEIGGNNYQPIPVQLTNRHVTCFQRAKPSINNNATEISKKILVKPSTHHPIPTLVTNQRNQTRPLGQFPRPTANSTITIKRSPEQPRNKPYLPTILYTNCRSQNQWKLFELDSYTKIHKPDIICLTETWLDEAKESSCKIDGYQGHFCHRKNRVCGGVCVFIAKHAFATTISIFTIANYHPPDANQSETLNHMSSTILKLTTKHKNAQVIIAGDFIRFPV